MLEQVHKAIALTRFEKAEFSVITTKILIKTLTVLVKTASKKDKVKIKPLIESLRVLLCTEEDLMQQAIQMLKRVKP